MVISDPISDMLTRINNGYMARKAETNVPWSKMKKSLAKVLCDTKYLESLEEKTVDGVKTLKLTLKYNQKMPAITSIKRISRPSLRVYAKNNNLPKVLGGLGIAVISTPAGLLTDREARKKGLGGEVICEIS